MEVNNMKNNMKKVMRMAFAFCMAAVMLCSGLAKVQAAGYTKSFTKTINITGGLLELTMDVKEDTTVTVTVSTSNKSKGLYIQPKMYDIDGKMSFVQLDKANRKGTFKVGAPKGTSTLYVENLTGKSVKVKIKVSAKAKVLKYKNKQIIEDVG